MVKNQLMEAGFVDVEFKVLQGCSGFVKEWMPGKNVEEFVTAAYLTGRRPVNPEGSACPAKRLRVMEAGV